jgi:predicted negative regulator of RcsB-dependent stress response
LNRNILYFVVGALVVAVAVLGYTTWQDRKQPEGLQISIGKQGVDVRNK